MLHAEFTSQGSPTKLTSYLGRADVWALSFGCAVGWGAFVMPGTTLLPVAGPVGTAIAMLIGAAIMLFVAWNFSYLAQRYPKSGGAFSFTKRILGYDHAFLCAWALVLAYVVIMWANASAFVLIVRYVVGPVLQVGHCYQVAGHDVYLGEVGVTLLVLVAAGLVCMTPKRLVKRINTTCAVLLLVGVVVCFVWVAVGTGPSAVPLFDPPFWPGTRPAPAVFGVVALAPWAFIGFEAVSHAAGECTFPTKGLFSLMAMGVVAAAAVYVLTTLVSVLGTPASYGTWDAYVADLPNLQGMDGLPVFRALRAVGGQAGLALLAAVVAAALTTSLLGLYRACSRLIYAMARDGLLPAWLDQVNADSVPTHATAAIMLISLPAPFVGRAAIGWIVDVSTVSAAITYFYASLCAYVVARETADARTKLSGVAGIVASFVFLVFPLVPNIWSISTLAAESYLIISVWSMLGLLLYRAIFRRDTLHRFGNSTVVWLCMIFLIFFSSNMWMRQVTHVAASDAVHQIDRHYEQQLALHGITLDREQVAREEAFFSSETSEIRQSLLDSSLVQMGLVVFSLAMMFSLYALVLRREKEQASQLREAEAISEAKTSFLSNMSHDLRTPMNAVIGYTHLARREGTTPEEAQEFLAKIDKSSKQLLALINDVLDMSRIESGKMELEPVPCDLRVVMAETRDLFATQMAEKGVAFAVDTSDLRDPYVLADVNRLNRVLLNLIANAYKFTPAGGSVDVRLAQMSDVSRGRASYALTVADTGMGMAPEFTLHLFEAFERERRLAVGRIEGAGLGMAITKSIVDLMGGHITVETALGEGTEFNVMLPLELSNPAAVEEVSVPDAAEVDFSGRRILVAEDNAINLEVARFILEDGGFEVHTAENGKKVLEMLTTAPVGTYDVILMDVRMPQMDGYEATRAIRELPDEGLSSIPIVAASANAFSEDVDKALAAGMDAYIAKPLDVDVAFSTLAGVLDSSAKK